MDGEAHAGIIEQLAEGGPAFRPFVIRRSRRTGRISVRDGPSGAIVHHFRNLAALSEAADRLSDGPSCGNDPVLLDELLRFQLEHSKGRKARGIHKRGGRDAASGRAVFLRRMKYAAPIAYLWVRAQKRRPQEDKGPQEEELRRLRAWTKVGRAADWDGWTETERDYAVAAAMVTKAFDWATVGLLDPLRPRQRHSGRSSAPEVFYRTYIQPRLSEVRELCRRKPITLRRVRRSGLAGNPDDFGGAHLRELLSCVDEIVTL